MLELVKSDRATLTSRADRSLCTTVGKELGAAPTLLITAHPRHNEEE
ncbi:MAG TPA: hypothetical protein V6D50_17255 [Chroococcales cyanobacterium]|jgi:hypothetical protein